ncbi:hypothetical protein GCM10022237_19460 [Nocardioides ginsengisoli]
MTLAALAGLFAMHGLADHGTASAPLPAAMVAAHHAPDAGHHEPGGTTGHDMAELCLALLVLAAGLASGLLARGRPVTASRTARPRWRVLVARAARFRAPPDLHRLSVQRC